MGLDQYAYCRASTGGNKDSRREIAYWRKHPNLHGFMEKLWLKKLSIPVDASDQFIEDKIPSDFNGVELELTWEDLDLLEKTIKSRKLPETRGFFFGNNADDYYLDTDLKFIRDARAELFMGLKVYYNSSW